MSQPQALESAPTASGSSATSEVPAHVVTHAGLRLHSAFQPIISVVHSKIVGHEALLRGHNERDEALSPAELFPQLVATLSARQVNETCARLHMTSFTAQQGEGWLFLNVSPDSMTGRAEVITEFGSWLEECGLSSHQIVVEIVETRAYDEVQLAFQRELRGRGGLQHR
jgi:EAL domain-containing protein (putative c-di-GMP-specific phosphodiesterase class I)